VIGLILIQGKFGAMDGIFVDGMRYAAKKSCLFWKESSGIGNFDR
jgi:hypothetical protein